MTARRPRSASDPLTYLSTEETPGALGIVVSLVATEGCLPVGIEDLSDDGVWVYWEQLSGSRLSSAEVAALYIARGCALAERVGGLPAPTRSAVRAALEQLTGPGGPIRP